MCASSCGKTPWRSSPAATGVRLGTALLRLAEVQRFDLHGTAAAATGYERAVASRDPDTAPHAMLGLADLVRDDDPERAADLYRRAADSGHTEVAPIARQALRD